MRLRHAGQQVARGFRHHRAIGGDEELEAPVAQVERRVGDLARDADRAMYKAKRAGRFEGR